ncbi:actin-like ATPase domain-containing protein [Exidia glandulosa HHB12029]|uniref:Actin-like ATPase domain-containing protein n=1 Tax=Exidia glandulosa HHB12029 TaxID=1314781 RepID=A0A165KGQ7_EXIGL|nr:actin-like ATPase domain-containing protein [Exidia glandulosa HHB12029]
MATNGEVTKTVIGINFGNTYSSIAVLSNEKQAECIANENGERQIASAVSFSGEETYIGNQALPQTVKNARNTITGFRNLLGKTFAEIPDALKNSTSSAPVIAHPESGLPAFSVELLVPASLPNPALSKTSALNTPKRTPAPSTQATPAPSPPPEPHKITKILTVGEVTTLYLKSLLQSATDYLGKEVDGAVLPVPAWFTPAAREALVSAAADAGIKILQLLDEPGAALLTLPTDVDRTVLILDVGASALELALVTLRAGLGSILAHSSTPGIGAQAMDDRLIAYFAREFTKKTKTPLSVAPPANEEDARAERKLRLAVESTKKAIVSSPGAAACSVESLKSGLDLSVSVNRLRFDLELGPVYASILKAVGELVKEPTEVDEVVFVGGSARLPGLVSKLELFFPEETIMTYDVVEPTEVLARGCALQAQALREVEKEEGLEVKSTSKPIGIFFPGGGEEVEEGSNFLTLVHARTPLPARRTLTLTLPASTERVGFEIWEASQSVVHPPPPPPKASKETGDDEDDEEEDEDEEEPESPRKVTKKETLLGALLVALKKGKEVTVTVEAVVGTDGAVTVSSWSGADGERETISVPAPAPSS